MKLLICLALDTGQLFSAKIIKSGLIGRANQHIYFHAGNNGGFRCFFGFSPEQDIAVAMMTKGANGLSLLPHLFNLIIGDIKPTAFQWGYEND